MSIDLSDPVSLALLTGRLLRQAKIDHALYGGLLLAAYGEARETRDADFAVFEIDLESTRRALEDAGLTTSISFTEVVFGGLTLSRIAVLGDRVAAGLNTVDLVRPRSDRFARGVLERSVDAPLRSQMITVVSPEDFVLLKLLSTRGRDIDDARSVLSHIGDSLDNDLIKEEVGALARELPDVPIETKYRDLLGS